MQDVNKRLEKATKIKGNARSAENSKQGHQRTPSFILALLQDALAKTKKPVRQPRGGFTDVGLHTGGESRATGWPLASSVSRFVVEQLGACHVDYEIIIAEWELALLEASLASPQIPPISLTRMLESVTWRGAVLADADNDMLAFEARAAHCRAVMDKRFSDSLRRQATLFEIPSLSLTGDGIRGLSHRLPCLVIAEELQARKELSSIEVSRVSSSHLP